jgi:hypothetical protein
VDGIECDRFGTPRRYLVLCRHPGQTGFATVPVSDRTPLAAQLPVPVGPFLRSNGLLANEESELNNKVEIDTLHTLDVPHMYRSGWMTPLGLYSLLEQHAQQTIILDDVSSVFKSRQCKWPEAERDLAWQAKTGKSPDTLYRHRTALKAANEI